MMKSSKKENDHKSGEILTCSPVLTFKCLSVYKVNDKVNDV